MNAIPVLDLLALEAAPEAVTDVMGPAYRSYGFCAFKNTGMDTACRDESYLSFRQFFALPDEMKMQCFLAGQAGRRGYTPMRVETARQGGHPDWKEFYHVGREGVSAQHLTRPHVADAMLENTWPVALPQFRSSSLALYAMLEGIGRRILSLMARDLGLDPGYFEDKVNYGNSILRALHYPALPGAIDGMRAAPHEDISMLTVLIGATDAGLQVQGQDGNFVPVVSDADTVVVNVGDMLQRLTNGVYRSATHQVVNPNPGAEPRPRYSVPFFLDPNPDFLIEALPSTLSHRAPLPPILAHDYLMERLREIKLA